MVRKIGGGTFCSDSDLFSRDNLFGIIETIKDFSSDVFNDSFELNGVTFIAEIGATLVPGVGGPPARKAYGSERKRVPSVASIL